MLNGEAFKGEGVPVEKSEIQEWQLSERLGFDVTTIVPYSSSSTFGGVGATSVLLWGKNGLAVVTNQNASNNTLNGSPSVGGVHRLIKKTIILGEKTYVDHPRLEVIQAKWLPNTFSTHPKTVAVLNSDNFFRFYQVDNTKESKAISCGSVSVEPNSSASIPFVTRSGRFAADVEDESVVDFDIGPCLPKSKYCTLFVLKESGCISYVLVRFVGKNTTFFSEAHGSIPTLGYDSEDRIANSIIVSKQFPVFVAIGFSGGVITHSIVLPEFEDSFSSNGKIDEGQNIEEKFIYDGLNLVVKERLDLDFLANSNSTHNQLKLVADPLHSHRYACIHDIGLHIVTSHFYPEVVKFFQSDDDEDFPEVTKCTYQLLLRWKLGDEAKPQRDLMALTFSERKPQRLLCVLQDLRTVIFELPDPSFVASLATFSGQGGGSNAQELLRPTGQTNMFARGSNIVGTCEALIKKSTVEPYLCSKEEIPIRELEEYVMQTIQMKTERLGGVEDGMQYLMKTVQTMQDKCKKMEELISNLSNIRGDLQSTAESFAERYEECVEQDELHVKRLEWILTKYHHASPVVTDKEKEWTKILEAIKEDLPDLRSAVEILKERMEDQNCSTPQVQDTLTQNQLRQIKEELKSQSESLNALSYSLKQISEHMYYPALMSVRPQPN
ncbi:Nuclear pore complex protein Nup88 [Orchesella cincta]|uniref:Nuclear pore complex protein Nup88 n=1 Tax=Orchesella cincta TaxID=48709 RepID=A0A1D2MIX7_ORCCI|nr:Nuclear pore complex protein Nup88 [Orchesella cincta]